MSQLRFITLRRTLLQGTAIAGMVTMTVLAMRLVGPPQASAQQAQQGEVRATAFALVGGDGTVLARLEPAPDGSGRLTLFDKAGTRRLALAGGGVLAVFDQDGATLRFAAGRTFEVGPTGNPPVNGIQLGANGSITNLPSAP
jgi:hypothetical protein